MPTYIDADELRIKIEILREEAIQELEKAVNCSDKSFYNAMGKITSLRKALDAMFYMKKMEIPKENTQC